MKQVNITMVDNVSSDNSVYIGTFGMLFAQEKASPIHCLTNTATQMLIAALLMKFHYNFPAKPTAIIIFTFLVKAKTSFVKSIQ